MPILQPLYLSVCSGQAQCWSPSHSSSTPASRRPSLKDKSSSSRHVLVPSTAARSSQLALVMREYRSLMGAPGKPSEPPECSYCHLTMVVFPTLVPEPWRSLA